MKTILAIVILLINFLIGIAFGLWLKPLVTSEVTITHFQTLSLLKEKKDCEKTGGIFTLLTDSRYFWFGDSAPPFSSEMTCEKNSHETIFNYKIK